VRPKSRHASGVVWTEENFPTPRAGVKVLEELLADEYVLSLSIAVAFVVTTLQDHSESAHAVLIHRSTLCYRLGRFRELTAVTCATSTCRPPHAHVGSSIHKADNEFRNLPAAPRWLRRPTRTSRLARAMRDVSAISLAGKYRATSDRPTAYVQSGKWPALDFGQPTRCIRWRAVGSRSHGQHRVLLILRAVRPSRVD
jgi:hypothetical protein